MILRLLLLLSLFIGCVQLTFAENSANVDSKKNIENTATVENTQADEQKGDLETQGETENNVKTNNNKELEIKESILRLQEIHDSLEEKKNELRDLQKQLRKTKATGEIEELKRKQDELLEIINKLNQAFEQVAAGGIDLLIFSNEPIPEFDWKKELMVVTKPLLDGLKELTEKPRRIEKLRNEIIRLENLYKMAQKGRRSLNLLQEQELNKDIKKNLVEVTEIWEKREADIHEALEMARYQLNSLHAQKVGTFDAILFSVQEFFQGRGVTLMIAMIAVFSVWLLMKILQWLILKLHHPHKIAKIRLRWLRITRYSFLAITVLLELFAAIMVFYARNDVLLLVLVIFGLLMVLLNLRSTLPRYIEEIRLLLDMGPVRQGERIIYNGIPYQIRMISVYSTLVNPELDGVVRLPISVMNSSVSRYRTEEAWFPCRPKDQLLLVEQNILAEVLYQSVENIRLKVRDSIVQIPTVDFLSLSTRNLSQGEFAVVVTFGVDYSHQSDCLTKIPQRFYESVTIALNQKYPLGLKELKVEFKEAGASSLDYIFTAKMKSEFASDYFRIGRFIQRTCVDICNQEQWIIPFTQLTIHQGEWPTLPEQSATAKLI